MGSVYGSGDMGVVQYMLLAVAGIVPAERTIPELHIGIVGIRLPACRAPVKVVSFALHPVYLVLKADRFAHRPPRAEKVYDIPVEIQEEIRDCDKRQEIPGEPVEDNAQEEQSRVQVRKILYLDREYEEKQHLEVGEQHRKGEKQRKVEVKRRGHSPGQKGVYCRQNYARQIIDVELEDSPLLLEGGAHHVVEIKRKDQRKQVGRGRDQDKSDKPPYLAFQDELGVKYEIIDYGESPVRLGQEENQRVSYYDIEHEVFDAITVVPREEPFEPVQRNTPFDRMPVITAVMIIFYPLFRFLSRIIGSSF